MTAAFDTHEFFQNLDAWVNQTTNPNAGGGTPIGDVGSILLRNGNGATATRPTEIYLRLAQAATGWTKQNLVNLNVYNVVAYGAVGNGSTDDTAAINAAVSAALAAGGGIIYFPPVHVAAGAFYRVTKPALNLGSIYLNNAHDLVFLGDGYASKIEMSGSAASGDWYMFRTRNGTSRIAWYNLNLSGQGITNPDPGQQNHLLSLEGNTTDPHGGTSDIDIVGMYFSPNVGDRVRVLGGDATHTVENVRYLFNGGDYALARALISCQKFTKNSKILYSWIAGSNDNEIDMEATGLAGSEPPTAWTIIGNHNNHRSVATQVYTLSGIAGPPAIPTERNVLAYNTVAHGGAIGGVRTQRAQIRGNAIEVDSTDGNSLVDLTEVGDFNEIVGNVLISANDISGRNMTSIQGIGLRSNTIAENVCAGGASSAARSQFGAELTDPYRTLVAGNIFVFLLNAVNKGIGIQFVPVTAVEMDAVAAIGNMIVNLSANALDSGINVHPAQGTSCRNFTVQYNWTRKSLVGVRLDRANAETFLDWRGCGNNNCLALTSATVVPPTDNSGVGVEGNAGPSPQMMLSNAAPLNNVTARVGSVLMNQLGASGGILSYKESATDKTGWLGLGGSEIVMGARSAGSLTTALYLAPGGGDLATADATEIQFAMPTARSLRNLRVRAVAGVGASNVTYTLRKNGVDTGQAVTIANTATGGVTGGGAVAFGAGDLVSVKIAKDAIPVTPQTLVEVTIEIAD